MNDAHETLSSTPFWIADWRVDPAAGRLHRDGAEVKLEPKVMTVLVCLAQQAGNVVSREELEAAAWAGTIVGYDALASSIIKLRKAFGDDSKNPQVIETLSKKGYRLIAPVRLGEEIPSHSVTETPAWNKRFAAWPVSVLAILGILFVGGIAWLSAAYLSSPDAPMSGKPSLVVLPFANLSDDPDQEYFSDGITEDLIIDLSQVSSLVVISRTSAFAYKNRPVDISQVAGDLGARFVLEGSVRRMGDQVRITAKLIDTQTNHSLWAERYDRAYKEIFVVQDEVTRKIVNALAIELTLAEKERLGRTDTNNLAAYEMFMRGQKYFRLRTKAGNELASDAYQGAIKLDPGYARAYGALAVVLTHDYREGWTEISLEEARARTLELARKAVVLDRASPQVYWSLSYVYLFRKQFKEAEAAVQQAVALSPNYADGYGLLAFINNWQGNAEQAVQHIKKAMALNPHHTFDYPWNLGLAYYTLGRYPEAVEAFSEALQRNEQAKLPRLYLAACYVRLGRQGDAEWEIEQSKLQYPNVSRSRLADVLPYEDGNLIKAFLEDLRKAGLPE